MSNVKRFHKGQVLVINPDWPLTEHIPKGILWYMKTTTKKNDSTILSLKTKKQVKALAQMRAEQLGMPLGTVVNAFLRNFGQTGEIHFTVAEPITPKTAKILEEMRAEIARGDTYGPFTPEEGIKFLESNTPQTLGLDDDETDQN